jgi:DNA-binding transcriptional ArsR family regulator
MVEYSLDLDFVFGSLSDPTRRDILQRLIFADLTVSEVANGYDLSLAAVSKHLKVLEKARLIFKQRRGKEQIVQLSPQTIADVNAYLYQYKSVWEERLGALDNLLKQETS